MIPHTYILKCCSGNDGRTLRSSLGALVELHSYCWEKERNQFVLRVDKLKYVGSSQSLPFTTPQTGCLRLANEDPTVKALFLPEDTLNGLLFCLNLLFA